MLLFCDVINFWLYDNTIYIYFRAIPSFSDGNKAHLLPVLSSITCIWEHNIWEIACTCFWKYYQECLGQVSPAWVRRCTREVIWGQLSSEEWRPSNHTVPRWAPTCCNWIRCSPSVIVWLCSLFHPLPLFLGRFRYVLLACNQGSIHF